MISFRLPPGSVALALEDDDLCVVDQAVDHGRDGYGIAEDLCPRREGLVGRDDEGSALVARIGGRGGAAGLAGAAFRPQWEAPTPARKVGRRGRRRRRLGGRGHPDRSARVSRRRDPDVCRAHPRGSTGGSATGVDCARFRSRRCQLDRSGPGPCPLLAVKGDRFRMRSRVPGGLGRPGRGPPVGHVVKWRWVG